MESDMESVMEGAKLIHTEQATSFTSSRREKNRSCVVFIDDNTLVLETVKKLLQEGAYELQLCKDAFKGLGKLVAHQPGAVFIDANMDKLSGHEFCALVKAQLKFRHIRLVMILQQADELSKARALAAGANAVIIKPFGKTELIKLLEHTGALAA